MSKDKEKTTAADEPQQESGDELQVTEATQPDEKTALPKKASRDKSTKNKAGPKRHFPWAATILLLVIVSLAAGNYWQFQQSQIMKQSQAQFGQQLSTAAQSIMSLDSQISETSDQQSSLSQKIQINEQNQQTLQTTLEQMSNQLKELAIAKGKEPLFWKVSEVEYLLSIANHRLILEKDVSTAKTALEDADKRLQAVGDPGLIPVRKQVASEIGMLKQVSLPDIAGMASQLTSMASTIEKLPFVKTARDLDSIDKSVTGKEGEDEANIVSRIVKDIGSGLFTIQRTDEPIEPLLPPEEKQYLKHNLSLKVEQARIALLNQDTELFQKNLLAIEEWTKKYFDPEDAGVASVLQSVATMKQVNLQPDLPDISSSLRNLRAWLSQQKQVAARADSNNKNQPTLASTKTPTQPDF